MSTPPARVDHGEPVEPQPNRSDEIVVRDDPQQHRYELRVGVTPAGYAAYHSQPGLVTVLHTEVDPAFEGQGLGSAFVRSMLDDIRGKGAKVLPVCPFVRSFLQRQPEYGDLVWRP